MQFIDIRHFEENEKSKKKNNNVVCRPCAHFVPVGEKNIFAQIPCFHVMRMDTTVLTRSPTISKPGKQWKLLLTRAKLRALACPTSTGN